MKGVMYIINIMRSLKTSGRLVGYFTKFTLKYFSLAALMNGCYNYGAYNKSNDVVSSIVLSKLHAFWLYMFEIDYSKIYYTLINNIAYLLHLPFNVVYILLTLFLLFLIWKLLTVCLGWYNMYMVYQLKKDKIITQDVLLNFGKTKTVQEYDSEMTKKLLRRLDEQQKEIARYKKKLNE